MAEPRIVWRETPLRLWKIIVHLNPRLIRTHEKTDHFPNSSIERVTVNNFYSPVQAKTFHNSTILPQPRRVKRNFKNS